MLVGAVTDLDLTGLITQAARGLSNSETTTLDSFSRRRLAGEPVARIIGMKEFWGLPLQLSAATLVPRPDTETLVQTARDLCIANPPTLFADLGTGSGAILLALLSEWPDAFGIGTDISADALRIARANAHRLHLAARAGFVACDYAAALRGAFDLIASNPPYIRSAEIATLATEVRDHDPVRALDGGGDGLDAYRTIAAQAAQLLKPDGLLVLEVGHDQSDDVGGLIATAGFVPYGPPRRDLGGVARVVVGRKMPR